MLGEPSPGMKTQRHWSRSAWSETATTEVWCIDTLASLSLNEHKCVNNVLDSDRYEIVEVRPKAAAHCT